MPNRMECGLAKHTHMLAPQKGFGIVPNLATASSTVGLTMS